MASHRWHEGGLHDVPGADIKSNVCATRAPYVYPVLLIWLLAWNRAGAYIKTNVGATRGPRKSRSVLKTGTLRCYSTLRMLSATRNAVCWYAVCRLSPSKFFETVTYLCPSISQKNIV